MINWTLWCCSVAFKKPLKLKRGSLATRTFLFIRYETHTGFDWCEASPLPQWSSDTTESCIQFLSANKELCFSELETQPDIPAAVSSGLWLSQLPAGAHQVSSNQLVLANDSSKELMADVLKVKVGVNTLADDISRLKSLISALNPNQRLRLDANQSWSFEEVALLVEALGNKAPIEYIEEPLIAGLSYESWQKLSPYSYALDESLVFTKPQFHPGLQALVLKPTILGKQKTENCLSFAKEHHLSVTISSSFESPVGLNHLNRLACGVSPNEYHGLNTASYLNTELEQVGSYHERPVTNVLEWQRLL